MWFKTPAPISTGNNILMYARAGLVFDVAQLLLWQGEHHHPLVYVESPLPVFNRANHLALESLQ